MSDVFFLDPQEASCRSCDSLKFSILKFDQLRIRIRNWKHIEEHEKL